MCFVFRRSVGELYDLLKIALIAGNKLSCGSVGTVTNQDKNLHYNLTSDNIYAARYTDQIRDIVK